jgi:DNA integrity scanning protein DisA with diadenylate cyclase activity
LETDLEKVQSYTLFNTITAIVHNAQEQKWGCTLVVDLNDEPIEIAGQKLSSSLSLTVPKVLDLAKSLAKMDGALHISKDLRLHRFGCLLDGHCVSGEDSSRGARYNSALRFTAENDRLIVIVVSADRPVSVVQSGVELSAVCEWQPVSQTLTPPTLTEWIERA